MAERTGLEPATSAVTGQRSNQLNYRSTVARLTACADARVTSGVNQHHFAHFFQPSDAPRFKPQGFRDLAHSAAIAAVSSGVVRSPALRS